MSSLINSTKGFWVFVHIMSNLLTILTYNGEIALREMGEKEFLRIQAKSVSSRHGICWHSALKAVRNSCDKLNDDEHSEMALRLANCFLEESGHKTYKCYDKLGDKNKKRECINQMSDRAFGVYNEFYIHTIHICYFLNHEIWQSETQDTIKDLFEASSRMKDQLFEASKMQGSMLESQKEGLKIQNQILDHGKQLGHVIAASTESVTNMVVNFRESIKDQKELLFQIFDYLKTLQDWIISEVSWFQSIIYYFVSCIICALFTASRTTCNARLILFTIQSINIILERMIVQYYDNMITNMNLTKLDLSYSIWYARKFTIFLSAVCLFYTYLTYKDEYIENLKFLQKIEERLDVIDAKSSAIRSSKRLALKRRNHKSSVEYKTV